MLHNKHLPEISTLKQCLSFTGGMCLRPDSRRTANCCHSGTQTDGTAVFWSTCMSQRERDKDIWAHGASFLKQQLALSLKFH